MHQQSLSDEKKVLMSKSNAMSAIEKKWKLNSSNEIIYKESVKFCLFIIYLYSTRDFRVAGGRTSYTCILCVYAMQPTTTTTKRRDEPCLRNIIVTIIPCQFHRTLVYASAKQSIKCFSLHFFLLLAPYAFFLLHGKEPIWWRCKHAIFLNAFFLSCCNAVFLLYIFTFFVCLFVFSSSDWPQTTANDCWAHSQFQT